jgi:hypothetical protein
MKNKFDRVREICGAWGLYEAGASSERAQLLKALSEIGELADSILKNDREQAKDDIGDILVCVINANEISAKRESMTSQWMPLAYSADESLSDLLSEIASSLAGDWWSRKSVFRSLYAIAKSFELTIDECIDQTISVIEKRKGKIINGAFVKDAD